MAKGILFPLWEEVLLFVILAGIGTRIIYAVFLSPLSSIPAGHWSARLSSLWIYYVRWSPRVSENERILRLHQKHGPVIQLGPNEISVASRETVKQIYTDRLPIASLFVRQFTSHETPNMFTTTDRRQHADRKRMIQNVYNKSQIHTSSHLRDLIRELIYGHLLPCIEESSLRNVSIELCELDRAYAMDAFTRYQFGGSLGTTFIQQVPQRRWYFDRYFRGRRYFSIFTEFPGLFPFFARLGITLLPKSVNEALVDLEEWNLDLCDKAERLLADWESNGGNSVDTDYPVIVAALRTALRRKYPGNTNLRAPGQRQPQDYPFRFDIASEMYNHNLGAHETTGNTLTYALFELSRNPKVQDKLRQELKSLPPSFQYAPGGEVHSRQPEPTEVETCRYLDAIVLETLRVWTVVPRARPRVTTSTCSFSGFDNIPPGSHIQFYPYALQRNGRIFSQPENWSPERWLESSPDHLAEMKRWMWSFGDGERMCVGMHFAVYCIKHAIAAIYTNFSSTLYEHGDMRLDDGFVVGPKGDRLHLKFHRI
ncbi:uncharacterized protein Z519_12721 [Cladophialophora bantiana CBS 173.52]|uniref:Cytochrome P450 monooxygenase n=1 Tax=Cladophialophora bantiana (strain ATCC 10958 / CBS 173.52 / CDC B-1940 / NIH 8579) TaxID=1442370 RepID=A0A0D2E965_CLAB1|nr:uncharacterized protein Z519_12721 [Cladophialophora bantiana CBS 173.52]KIW86666.1 hypothetical protein Z519_12721 [Cladophialophora bantiana CBS 173.52]